MVQNEVASPARREHLQQMKEPKRVLLVAKEASQPVKARRRVKKPQLERMLTVKEQRERNCVHPTT